MEEEREYGTYRYRWVVLAVYMLVAAITQLMWLNYAPITSQTEALMGVSEFKVVLLATMFPLVYVVVSIPAGFIIDRKGFRYAVMIGSFLTAAFSFLRLFADNYVLVLIGMIGISVGQPFVLNSITKLVSTWFPSEESALASGLGTLSLFVGMIVALAVTPGLLKGFGENNLSSLRWIVLIYSLVALLGFILFAILGKAKPPKPPKRTEEAALGEEVAVDMKGLRSIFGLHNFRMLCVIIFIGNGSFVALMQLIEKIMEPKGIGTVTAGNIGAVMVGAGVVGCIVLPALSDKLMRRKPFLILAASIAAITLFLVGILKSATLNFIVGGILGFFLLSALPVLLAFAEETTGARLTGVATSILLLLGNAGGVVLTLAVEGIKSATGGKDFLWGLVVLAALFVVAFFFALRIREEHPISRVGAEE
ncbi:MAG: MFS transporter [Actinomycetota bacterium]|nr:MFS transporter [Actinomycetota bacterium]